MQGFLWLLAMLLPHDSLEPGYLHEQDTGITNTQHMDACTHTHTLHAAHHLVTKDKRSQAMLHRRTSATWCAYSMVLDSPGTIYYVIEWGLDAMT